MGTLCFEEQIRHMLGTIEMACKEAGGGSLASGAEATLRVKKKWVEGWVPIPNAIKILETFENRHQIIVWHNPLYSIGERGKIVIPPSPTDDFDFVLKIVSDRFFKFYNKFWEEGLIIFEQNQNEDEIDPENLIEHGEIMIHIEDPLIPRISIKAETWEIVDRKSQGKDLDGLIILALLAENAYVNREKLGIAYLNFGREKLKRRKRGGRTLSPKTIGDKISSAKRMLKFAKSSYEIVENEAGIRLVIKFSL